MAPTSRENCARTDALLRVSEVADLLRVSPGWVRRSPIPAVLLGRSRRYRPEDIRSHTASRTARRTPREAL